MTLSEIFIAALACWQVVEVWKHSRLSGWLRCRAVKLPGLIGYFFNCAWCFSIWIALLLVVALTCHAWSFYFVAVLAISRLANLFNDITHPFSRTSKWSNAEQIEYEASKHGPDTEYV